MKSLAGETKKLTLEHTQILSARPLNQGKEKRGTATSTAATTLTTTTAAAGGGGDAISHMTAISLLAPLALYTVGLNRPAFSALFLPRLYVCVLRLKKKKKANVVLGRWQISLQFL